VRTSTEFPSLEAYLDGYALTGSRLAGLRVPARLLLAQDDPIIPAVDLGRLARPDGLEIVSTRYGGHCGFIDRMRAASFADRMVVEQFDRHR
jgi:hypothetical protein